MLLDYNKITKGLNIRGVIHVGGHTAEERGQYDCPVMWIEADPDLYKIMPVTNKFNFAATDYNGKAKFNIMPFKAANSLLKPNLNSKRRKDVYVEKIIEVDARRIETIQTPLYNFINLDIQGNELKALQGTNLDYIDYVYSEVHEVETYHGCSKIWELDELLIDFERVETRMLNVGWGDALWVRKNIN